MPPVTELDFRMPGFRDAKPEDYERDGDGLLVRKDRWEMAVRSIAYLLREQDTWSLPEKWTVAEVVVAVQDVLQQLGGTATAAAAVVLPEPGYRFLKTDEMTQAGDERWDTGLQRWDTTAGGLHIYGCVAIANLFRRKFEPIPDVAQSPEAKSPVLIPHNYPVTGDSYWDAMTGLDVTLSPDYASPQPVALRNSAADSLSPELAAECSRQGVDPRLSPADVAISVPR